MISGDIIGRHEGRKEKDHKHKQNIRSPPRII
jgi:hypothetical protein